MREELPSIENLISDASFVRWVKGRSMPVEARKWDHWIQQHPENRRLVRKAQEKLLGVDFLNKGDIAVSRSGEWNSLMGKIEDDAEANTFSLRSRPPEKSSFLKWIFRIAAVLLVAASTGFAAHFHLSAPDKKITDQQPVEWKTIETEFRQQKTVALSDGSTITLNANSSITYPAGWVRGNVTEVYLEGEAYFSIVSRRENEQPPFKVFTDDGEIEVLGTKFVVATSEHDTRVGLEEGEIIIRKEKTGDDTGESAREYTIRPNEKAEFSRKRDSIAIEYTEDVSIFSSWKDHKIVLKSSPLSYLEYRLESTYGVNVVVKDENLYQRRLTGTLNLKELDHLVESISDVMDIEVSVEAGTVFLGKKDKQKKGGQTNPNRNK